MHDIQIRDAVAADMPAIRDIYNDAVENSTAIWNEIVVDAANRLDWWRARLALGYPVLVADRDGTVLGYASFGDFRPFDGYRHTAEHSVYVAAGGRGLGIGTLLLGALEARARAIGKHVLIGGVEAGNDASMALHRRMGFIETGRLREVGRKFDRWLDLVFMQKTL
ncbi:MAG: N-acetyltransferase [Hyphomicrobiaceae bacterium]|nr:N-acetyltransferase [Hyphomicrobiaceae bacterium]